MRHFKIIFIFLMMLFLTIGYHLFLQISSEGASLLVELTETSPGFLFDLVVKPYIAWIVLAWLSFFINTAKVITPLLKKKDPVDYIQVSFFHLMWVCVTLIWYMTAILSPFFGKALVII